MDNKLSIYQKLSELFNEHGYILYMVGGTVRDYILKKELTDMDLVTDATPSDIKEFLMSADYTFEKYGSVKVKVDDVKFDITTLRKEEGYSDYRHPNKICFTKSIKEDVFRRDITINALYMDEKLNVIDLVGGVKDIDKHLIRMIGDPTKRINEDPLRILRIYRFKLELGFEVDKELEKVIKDNAFLIKKLNKDKVISEVKKSHHQEELIEILKSLGIMIDLK